MADDPIAGHQHRRLARGHAGEGLAQIYTQGGMPPNPRRRRDGGGEGARAVTQLHRVDRIAIAKENHVSEADAALLQLGAGTDRDRVGGRVGGEHVEGLRG